MKNTPKKNQLSRLVVRGFKSIVECDIKLSSLNILIGANGAGKSNFIHFFDMIRSVALDNIAKRGEGSTGNFVRYTNKGGGANNILHFGTKNTAEIYTELHFEDGCSYSAHFMPQASDLFFIEPEMFAGPSLNVVQVQNSINFYMRNCYVYHFFDPSDSARIKNLNDIHDSKQLLPDGSNLAAFLLRLRKKYPNEYRQIVETVKLVAPFFVDFHLEPNSDNPDRIRLMWAHKYMENESYNFYADNFSDGTLRFACLVSLLLQPIELQPEIILIDEPELGFHPYAINILAELIKAASIDKQIIISTQSVELLNLFEPENVIVVDREKNQSTFKRLKTDNLAQWLEDYTLGELWKKNILGGRPTR